MREKTIKLVFVVWAIIAASLMGGTIYVAIHFLRRYW